MIGFTEMGIETSYIHIHESNHLPSGSQLQIN